MGIARFIEAAVAGQLQRIYADGRQLRDLTNAGDAVAAPIVAAQGGEPRAVYKTGRRRSVHSCAVHPPG
jgi:nucleoside-diphosphate-sugar epimerase